MRYLMTGGSDLILHDPLFFQDGGFYLSLAGRTVPLMMQGAIVPYLLPGWRASHLYTGFAPLFLLELVHEDTTRATWFLDFRMHHVADTVETLGSEMVDLLRLKAVPVLNQLLHTALHQCWPVLSEASLAFLTLNDATRRAIAVNCLDLVLRPPSLFLAEQLMPASLIMRGERDDGLRSLSRVHLAAGLAEDFQDRLATSFGNGTLTWPSPIDGAPLQTQGCFCFDDFHFAYRFADDRHGLVFFAVVAEHYSDLCGVWFPSLGLMVSRDEAARNVVRSILRHMPYWFVTHICQWAELAVPYLTRGADRFASVLRGRPGVHIGHQLWNELSGIDRLLAEEPLRLPEWIVLDAADGTELYGPLEKLFPALEGHVNRELDSIPAMIRHAYSNGVMILRVTREHVAASLRLRILAEARASTASHQALRIIADARHVNPLAPVILLGLRVENRTLVDLDGFFMNLVGFIVDRFPGAVIVLDGHNARGTTADGRVIESHGESLGSRKPVEVERDLVSSLRHRFQDRPVRIADTIGQPIETSLAWMDRCDCFFSIWGASLAKYRWVCNKTGMAISSRTNLIHRRDLHIYNSDRFMEAPTLLRFPDPDLVMDRPEAPLLINVVPGDPSFFNFEIEEAKLFPQIAEMIEQSLAARHFPGPPE